MYPPSVEAVIPSYRPDGKLAALLLMLHEQSVPLKQIHLIQTTKEGFSSYLQRERMTEEAFFLRFPLVRYHEIAKEEFDHGKTRDYGMRLCESGYVLFMTQDAVPKDRTLIEKLLEPFGKLPDSARDTPGSKGLAVSYARQLPEEGAKETEKFGRSFNYPAVSVCKTEADVPRLGIKTYFCSNVCALYKRDLYETVGGFPFPVVFNEDMIYAGRALKKGYGVAYCADAEVIHSHSYTAKEQHARNFDLGASQTDHPEIFGELSSEGEGKKLVLGTVRHLLKTGHPLEVFPFFTSCAARFLGYRRGRRYPKYDKKRIMKWTMNPGYWERWFQQKQG